MSLNNLKKKPLWFNIKLELNFKFCIPNKKVNNSGKIASGFRHTETTKSHFFPDQLFHLKLFWFFLQKYILKPLSVTSFIKTRLTIQKFLQFSH